MTKRAVSNVKLGVFVLGGLLFLVLLLYMIGKNRSLFGSTYVLKARFENVQGLVPGNNVRFSGIEAGTVKRIKILNDTTIEVTMAIEKKMMSVIRKDAMVSIGTEGFVGNKVVNIVPSGQPGAFAEESDILISKRSVDTETMLQTLSKTNDDVAVIASNLKSTVQRINSSSALWSLLNDNSLPRNLNMAVANLRSATNRADHMVNNLDALVMDVKDGKGSLGALLTDTSFIRHLHVALQKIETIGDEADSLANEINKLVGGIQHDVDYGKGTINVLLKDSMMAVNLGASLQNIKNGTDNFNQNMEAIKHNFLLREYFRKIEKQKKKDQLKTIVQEN